MSENDHLSGKNESGRDTQRRYFRDDGSEISPAEMRAAARARLAWDRRLDRPSEPWIVELAERAAD